LAHYNNTWSDWSFHASYATTFVYGHNLPPQNPLFAGTPFRYPFAPDFASALLIGGGWSLPAALIWPSWAMTVLALSGLILCPRHCCTRHSLIGPGPFRRSGGHGDGGRSRARPSPSSSPARWPACFPCFTCTASSSSASSPAAGRSYFLGPRGSASSW